MTKPAWVESTGPGPISETLDLGHGLKLTVGYEGMERLTDGAPYYNVSVFGRRLVARSTTMEAGKLRAVRAARSWLSNAIADLPE